MYAENVDGSSPVISASARAAFPAIRAYVPLQPEWTTAKPPCAQTTTGVQSA